MYADIGGYRIRQEKSLPALANVKALLDQHHGRVTPKSKLGEALAYLEKMWPKLTRYTERGDLPIDNNACENAIRPFVIGRKAGCLLIRQRVRMPVLSCIP